MSAAQCREHRWLAKKPSKQQVEQTVSKSKSKVPQQIHEIPRLETSNAEELDVAKDNLRLFVERWREHPNSPYMLDIPSYNFLQNSTKEYDDRVSLKAHSPSPCASICSTPSETADSSPRESHSSFLTVPGFGFERRASEGIATEKSRGDPASQIILAEEIIKLSEHLRSIAMGTCVKSNDDDVRSLDSQQKRTEKPEEKSARNGVHSKSNGLVSAENNDCNEITEKLSSIMRHRKINGTTFHSSRNFEKYTETNSGNIFAPLKKQKQNAEERGCSRKEQDRTSEETTSSSVRSQSVQEKVEGTTRERNVRLSVDGEMDLTPPWRRSRVKHLFGETSRDVPRITELRNLHKSLNLDEPTSTKDLLLHLLEEWDGVATRPSGVGRKSVSVDWCGEESVGRKTMNSLAEYFQARQQKSTASSVNSTAQNSVHR